MIYEFENCILDAGSQELHRDGEPVAVQPQVFAVLEYLLANPDRVVSKMELLDEVWGDRFVSESALTSRIKLARQACGDTGRAQRVIKTVHGRGYRFVADLTGRGPTSLPTSAKTKPSTTAVARDVEIEQLVRAADAAAAPATTTVFVTGSAGMGKSTVVDAFLELEDLDRWTVLRGRCHRPRSGPEPYFALLDALGGLASAEPELVRETLDRVAPSWLVQLPTLVDDDTAERLERRLLGGARQRMLREGAEGFVALARRRPTVLVLDDLHQADDCTLDALELLASRRDRVPLLVVAMGRPGIESVDSFLSDLCAAGDATEIPVGPLDETAIGRILGDRRPGAGIDDRLIQVAHERSDGNPLFAQEMFTAWEASDLLVDRDGTISVASVDEVAAMIPPGLMSLIERTLDALDADERSVLEAAAAVGTDFDAAATAAGLDRTVVDVEAVLDRMARRLSQVEVVGATTWPDGTVSTAYRFVHQLHRDVVHERTAVARRAELHHRIGLALEHGFESARPSISATLADHFAAAGDDARAARHLRLVAAQAMARQAHGNAEGVLRRALEHWERIEPGTERDALELEIRLSLGQARVAIAGWSDEDAGAHYERALTVAAQLGATEQEANARYALATMSEVTGDFERTEALLAPVLVDGSDALDIEAHELVACSTFHQGAFARSEQNADAVLSSTEEDVTSAVMARISEHPATSCNSWMSLSNWFLGRSDDSLRRADNAVRLGERHQYALAMALQQRAMLHQLRDEPVECREWAARACSLDREHLSRARRAQSEVLGHWAEAAIASATDGDGWGDAVAALGAAVDGLRSLGVRLDAAYYVALHADALVRHGHGDQALVLLDVAESEIDATRTYFHRPEIHRLRGRALLLADGPAAASRAAKEFDEALALARSMGSPALALRIVCDRVELEEASESWRSQLSELVARYDGQRPPPDVVRGRTLLAAAGP